MATQVADQVALDEQVIEDADLEASLEAREDAKQSAAFARKAYKEQDDQAKAELEKAGLEEGAVARCGRFRIEKVAVKPKQVSFETGPSTRLKITAPEE